MASASSSNPPSHAHLPHQFSFHSNPNHSFTSSSSQDPYHPHHDNARGSGEESFVSISQISFSDEEDLTQDYDDAGRGRPAAATKQGGMIRGKLQRSSALAAQAAISSSSSSSSASASSAPSSANNNNNNINYGSSSTTNDSSASARRNPIRQPGKRSQPLDFSTLRTSSPRALEKTTKKERLFGLQHAPVYYPTIEEFGDPIRYIESIAEEAKKSGICKIVPPEGWTPSFALDSETFRFKTRLQQLNSMEASARASLNFLEQLHLFHTQQGNGSIIVPVIEGKPLNLWMLRREVNAMGGYNAVTSERKWTSISKAMGYDVRINTSVCSNLKTAYSRLIVPFEHYVTQTKMTAEDLLLNVGDSKSFPSPFAKEEEDEHPDSKVDDDERMVLGTPKDRSGGANSLATPDSELAIDAAAKRPAANMTTVGEMMEKVRTASDMLNLALNTGSTTSASTSAGANSMAPPAPTVAENRVENESANEESEEAVVAELPGDSCEICSMDHDPEKIVLCDVCDRGFHLSCLTPALDAVPRSEFYCEVCLLMEGADYGFEEGTEHSLNSFRRRADAFKRNWLEDHPLPATSSTSRNGAMMVECEKEEDENVAEQIAIEQHFEREFWRLVESPNETVEVEYGADVDASKNGGAFPNLEVHPNDPYSRDPWNLNNLPILSGSLLRYIKSDISGMTIPWMYVGMCFSTFAWHKEDHYTYSINYHHWGDTKTWYGIPGEDDEKLEATMKLAAPELLAQQPDLLFQLVTLMSPGRLKANGVRVVACDQRPREFIITFPRAYHSGFNHGFNFNEAVNFALADWLPTGLKCVNRYQDIRKNPVFSHDELLITISHHEKSAAQSAWLYPNWEEMVVRELASRNKIRSLIPTLLEIVDDTDLEEEEYQCESCRILCYLAQVTTEGIDKIACADHVDTLEAGPKVMRMRYSDADLLTVLARVKQRAEKVLGPIGTAAAAAGGGGGKKRKSSFTLDIRASTRSPIPSTSSATLESSAAQQQIDTVQSIPC